MTKISDFIKNKGTSLSRNRNAPIELRKQYSKDSTNNINSRDSLLKFYPVINYHKIMDYDGYSPLYDQSIYSVDVFLKVENSDISISSITLDIPEYFNMRNVDIWNTITKTRWANNVPEIFDLPYSEWPSGTNTNMLPSDLIDVTRAIQNTNTIWRTFIGIPASCGDSYNGGDWDESAIIQYFTEGYTPDSECAQMGQVIHPQLSWTRSDNIISSGVETTQFNMLGTNNRKGNFGWFIENTFQEGVHNDFKSIDLRQNFYYKFLRIENLTPALAGGSANLFNLCLQQNDLKVYDSEGQLIENVQGMCTSDLAEEAGLNLTSLEDRRMLCDGIGGTLCRRNNRQCVYDTRLCRDGGIGSIDEGEVLPMDCDCNTFDCRQCFDNLIEFGVNESVCCRRCCSQDVIDIPDGISGCTDRRACNYWSMSNVDDGSCWYPRDRGWCDCNENVLDECGVCGGVGQVWGQNGIQTIDGVPIFPDVGCCSERELRQVYFDRNCDGVGDGRYPFDMCYDNISSSETTSYCLQITNNECAQCFVQSSVENMECNSGMVDCMGLCDGNSEISKNPITGKSQCCTEIQKDKCGVCFGDNSSCTCNPNFIGDNVHLHDKQSHKKIKSSTQGCVCGCTDKNAVNFNPKANWPCGSKKEDNLCFDSNRPDKNACCYYWPGFKPDEDKKSLTHIENYPYIEGNTYENK